MKRGSRLTKFEQERLDSWKTVYQPWCLDSDKKKLMKNFKDIKLNKKELLLKEKHF